MRKMAAPTMERLIAVYDRAVLLRRIKVLLVLAALQLFAACTAGDRVLELEFVGGFRVQEVSQSPMTIRLTGLVMHSALGIRKIITSQENRLCQVLVYVALAANDRPANMDHLLIVPDDVDAVSFGTENTVVWRRGVGPVYKN